MKRELKGFTFSEVLITLGIIGVIASLTLPSLTINIVKQQTGPSLAKAINSLETTNKLALQEGSARSLDQLTKSAKQQYFDEAIVNYMVWRVQNVQKPYYNYNGATAYATGASTMHTTKDGITYLHANEGPKALSAARKKVLSRGYSGDYYTVYIDVNGNAKGPNALGKDLFQVLVDTKGTVIPYGGVAWNAYTGNAVKWTGNGCANKKVHPTDPLSCAGSIADNGFRVIY